MTSALAAGGKDPAALEARLLLECATGFDALQLLAHENEALGEQAAERLRGYLQRRIAGCPINRILGRSGFFGLDLLVTPDVLDPRADTETLVQAAIDFLRGHRQKQPTILDLGTGSGAILCALLDAVPDAFGIGVDLSPAACNIARANLARCGLDIRSAVLCGHWAESLSGAFDLVVSNPPYIALTESAELATEVTDHDPPLALFGGKDGLDCYRQIAASLPSMLKADGQACFEIGWRQAASAGAIFEHAGFAQTECIQDLGGRDRVLVVSRR